MKPLIAYGSTMHGSEKIAKWIAEKYGVEAHGLNKVDMNQLKSAKFAIFVIATFGEGQFPKNCQEFCMSLNESTVDLSNLKFALLALGSTHYKYFCRAGEQLYKMLTDRGAKEIIPYVRSDKCDADHGEGVIAKFKRDVVGLASGAKPNQSQGEGQKPIVAYASTMSGSMKIAKRIAEQFGTKEMELNALSVDELANCQYAVFVVATFGDGEFPDNGKEFAERLRGSSTDLHKLKFALLGMGSTKYKKFCQASEELYKMLTYHNAKPAIPFVKSDKVASDGGVAVIEKFVNDALNANKQDQSDIKVLVGYASTMSGSQKVAKRIAEQIGVEANELNKISLETLSAADYAIFVVATFGNGDYPDNGQEFADKLRGSKVNLQKLKFSLLALGSTKYPNFCKAGEDMYNLLTQHGAKSCTPLAKSDKVSKDGGDSVIEKFVVDSIKAKPSASGAQKPSSGSVIIAYGSTMHGSEKIANRIAEKFGYEASELNKVSLDQLSKAKLVIMVVGTIGNGHYPKNCEEFANTLSKSRVNLTHLKFALLGLGSTYYEQFCKASANINQLFVDHGAKPVFSFLKSDKAATDQGQGAISEFESRVAALLSNTTEESNEEAVKPLIAYGSARHGAENIAKELAEKFGVTAVEMNSLKIPDLEETKIAIFVISTTGEGQYPMNCKKFCESLNVSKADLRNLQFAELALGSSYYTRYCRAGDELNKMLTAKGAKPFVPYIRSNKADEDYGEGSITKFKESVISAIGSLSHSSFSASVTVELTETKEKVDEKTLIPEGYIEVEITSKKLLSASSYAPALHKYTVKLPSSIKYGAGDHCYIMPQNDPSVVEKVLSKLGYKPDTIYNINASGSLGLPKRATVSQLFTRYVDLNARPPRGLSDAVGASALSAAETVAELLLHSTGTTKIDELLKSVPYIEPRTYSISSEKTGELDLIIGDVSFGNGHPGLCTHYLTLPTTKTISIQTMKGLFTYPEDVSTPLIIFALGTGISPVFSLIEHRAKLGNKIGKCLVFFGTRYNDASKGAVEELQAYEKKGAITKLFVAISREGKKQHIQDVVKENGDDVWSVWENDKCQAFYCGPPNNAIDEIRELLIKLALSKANMTRTEAVWHCSHHTWCVEQF